MNHWISALDCKDHIKITELLAQKNQSRNRLSYCLLVIIQWWPTSNTRPKFPSHWTSFCTTPLYIIPFSWRISGGLVPKKWGVHSLESIYQMWGTKEWENTLSNFCVFLIPPLTDITKMPNFSVPTTVNPENV